jgi:hypothetical protein
LLRCLSLNITSEKPDHRSASILSDSSEGFLVVQRSDAPLRLRLIFQPLMAALVAIRDGLRDARTGCSPYLWTVLRDPRRCAGRLNEGLNRNARIILLAVAADAIYQVIVLKRFYPTEAVGIAVLLAFVPYLVIRGPVTRLARLGGRTGQGSGSSRSRASTT